MTLHTNNRITIGAAPSLIFQLGADVGRWPEMLSHYRYVRVLEEHSNTADLHRRLVKMAASRSGIPVSWTSIQELEPKAWQIRYRHVAGVTRGMDVVWRVQPGEHDTVVTIDHDLDSPYWWLRSPLARFIVGRMFITYIAGKTLAGIKREAEARTCGQPVP